MLIPRTHLLKILTPFLGSIYITTLIFTRNIIISVKIDFSLRLNIYIIFSGDGNLVKLHSFWVQLDLHLFRWICKYSKIWKGTFSISGNQKNPPPMVYTPLFLVGFMFSFAIVVICANATNDSLKRSTRKDIILWAIQL